MYKEIGIHNININIISKHYIDIDLMYYGIHRIMVVHKMKIRPPTNIHIP